MAKKRESSEVVKSRIMDVAADLFAKHGIDGVSIRKIAAGAGINHALVIRYFGSKSQLVTEILRRQILSLTTTYTVDPKKSETETLGDLRQILLKNMVVNNNAWKLIIRSGLDGLTPESFVDPGTQRAADIVAKWIEAHQTGEKKPDAKLLSILIMGSLFSLISIAPWLMTSVGFPPDDFENRKEDIMDVILWIIKQAIE